MNSLQTLYVYNFNETYVFDDPAVGLVREPFVLGIPEMFESLMGGKLKNFTVIFSSEPFPGVNATLKLMRPELGGNWYSLEGKETPLMEGWLCPALFKYFEVAPEYIYVQFTNVVLQGPLV